MEARAFGVTKKELCGAAYSYAITSGIELPESWSTKNAAGKDWYLSFCKRNNLSLRKPEGLSKARAAGFNKEAVNFYFDVLGNVMKELDLHNRPPMYIIWMKVDFL